MAISPSPSHSLSFHVFASPPEADEAISPHPFVPAYPLQNPYDFTQPLPNYTATSSTPPFSKSPLSERGQGGLHSPQTALHHTHHVIASPPFSHVFASVAKQSHRTPSCQRVRGDCFVIRHRRPPRNDMTDNGVLLGA